MKSLMKSILITGAASGIGAATVKKIASKNISFTLTTKSNEQGLRLVSEYAKKKVLALVLYVEI